MNVQIINARAEFWRAYDVVKRSLKDLPSSQLVDLQHEAHDHAHLMTLPFSERAAAQLVHAAATELLGG